MLRHRSADVRPGSLTRETEMRWVWRPALRERVSVLDCVSPLPLFTASSATPKRQRAAAVQDLTDIRIPNL